MVAWRGPFLLPASWSGAAAQRECVAGSCVGGVLVRRSTWPTRATGAVPKVLRRWCRHHRRGRNCWCCLTPRSSADPQRLGTAPAKRCCVSCASRARRPAAADPLSSNVRQHVGHTVSCSTAAGVGCVARAVASACAAVRSGSSASARCSFVPRRRFGLLERAAEVRYGSSSKGSASVALEALARPELPVLPNTSLKRGPATASTLARAPLTVYAASRGPGR